MSDNEPAQHSPNYGGWASFEVEIRARRYARCLQAAQEALDAGNIEEAKDWIAEGRFVSFASPELDELERRISTRSAAPMAPVDSGISVPREAQLPSVPYATEEVEPQLLELEEEPEPEQALEEEPEPEQAFEEEPEPEQAFEEEPVEEPAILAPAGLREQAPARDERSVWEERVPLRADVFRRPDPGLKAESDLLRPGDCVLFGSSAADERSEVG